PLCARFSLVFYCHVHHRYLHSFPTRRSSDLLVPAPALRLCAVLPALGGLGEGEDGVDLLGRGAVRDHPAHHGGPDHRVPGARVLDRKSTRLNSSHVKISYAVFCLKKKKTNDT